MVLPRTFDFMQKSFAQEKRNDENEADKVSFLVIKKIRNAILDETFKPADHLMEAELETVGSRGFASSSGKQSQLLFPAMSRVGGSNVTIDGTQTRLGKDYRGHDCFVRGRTHIRRDLS